MLAYSIYLQGPQAIDFEGDSWDHGWQAADTLYKVKRKQNSIIFFLPLDNFKHLMILHVLQHSIFLVLQLVANIVVKFNYCP